MNAGDASGKLGEAEDLLLALSERGDGDRLAAETLRVCLRRVQEVQNWTLQRPQDQDLSAMDRIKDLEHELSVAKDTMVGVQTLRDKTERALEDRVNTLERWKDGVLRALEEKNQELRPEGLDRRDHLTWIEIMAIRIMDHKIWAIKLFRNRNGCSLLEAKNAIEEHVGSNKTYLGTGEVTPKL